MRLFFGIPVPEAIASDIYSFVLKQKPALKHSVCWVPLSNYHVTLCFLGEIQASSISSLMQKVTMQAGQWASFQVNLSEIGLFPCYRSQRVVVTVEKNFELSFLHSQLSAAIKSIYPNLSFLNYRPHITILRNSQKNTLLFKESPLKLGNKNLDVNQVILYQSLSSKGGVFYRSLDQIVLLKR